VLQTKIQRFAAFAVVFYYLIAFLSHMSKHPKRCVFGHSRQLVVVNL